MLSIEIETINKALDKNYRIDDIYFEDNVLVEKVSGNRTELTDDVFDALAKAKRKEHLRRFGC